ncbi:polysaccharide deacetylase family protein [Glycomyces sp. L485]|uniref:polysaccharide deacetylase family protein n=1 Tax=Glycomyces sp. L485 TaxID=2909235 RepID=UPI001F4B78A1|nr:polysaccharide deacetylase family protein [Glycomyces sp. L485]MCH7232135.1 polysaccharide deacetylase family protein [Glycomyces sp. L485]
MRRFKIGIGVAATLFILLAWAWPNGPDAEQDRSGAETSATESPSPDRRAAAEPEPEQTSPSEEEPSPTEAEPSGEPETGPVGERHRGPLGTRDRTGADTIALTFDDGPDPKWTPRVLDRLREDGVKATFCVIGAYAEANPDLIADIVHDGHTLCSHTWFHEFDLGRWSDREIRANLQRTNDAIQKAAPGTEVRYFRHPGGRWTQRAIAVAADMGMESLHWAVDPSDWDAGKTEAQIRNHVLNRTKPGSIVLLHDGASNQRHMYGALGSILDEFGRRGYAMVAL